MTVIAPSELRLPQWVRVTFWTVVTVEWAVALAGIAFVGWALFEVGMMFSCARADTVYSKGYSDQSWALTREGDTKAVVLGRLGEPLDRWPSENDEVWAFSRHGSRSDDYLERKVHFTTEGRVFDKHEECYID